jgi:hypothetical protein
MKRIPAALLAATLAGAIVTVPAYADIAPAPRGGEVVLVAGAILAVAAIAIVVAIMFFRRSGSS